MFTPAPTKPARIQRGAGLVKVARCSAGRGQAAEQSAWIRRATEGRRGCLLGQAGQKRTKCMNQECDRGCQSASQGCQPGEGRAGQGACSVGLAPLGLTGSLAASQGSQNACPASSWPSNSVRPGPRELAQQFIPRFGACGVVIEATDDIPLPPRHPAAGLDPGPTKARKLTRSCMCKPNDLLARAR